MHFGMKCLAGAVAAGLGLWASPASATVKTFNVNLTGAKETNGTVFNLGDLNGSAVGTITLDSGTTGNTATAVWNFVLSGLPTPPVTDFHIHTGTASQQGGVFIGFGVNTGAGDVLTASQFSGSRSGLNSANMATVLADPAGFYLNMHNGEFPGGAIRDQVPEPATVGLMAVVGVAALARRRRRA